MPIYPYHCDNCNITVEDLRSVSDRDKPFKCKKCGAEVQRLFTCANLVSGAESKGLGTHEQPPVDSENNTAQGGNIGIFGCKFSHSNVGISLPKGANVTMKHNQFEDVKTPVEFRDD